MRKLTGLFALLNGAACAPWVFSPCAAATLPVPCTGSVCANGKFGVSGFVSAGSATATSVGSKLTVNQTSKNATLNWQSFNISANGTVQFVQPSASAVALNQINDANPSQIFGALNANGRVFLINQNGIVFGSGAQVNVGGLVASTLNIASSAASGGLIAPGASGNPAFSAFSTGTTGGITISQGAKLQTASGGEILIFAPQISNQGTISTPDGQTVLAAGDTIYIATQSDATLRGILVQVGGTGGTVTNGTPANSSATTPEQLVGQIVASDGNVTLAGLAVNQLGRVSATTSINQNGSIYLQAGDHGSITPSGAAGVSGTLNPGAGGRLTAGVNSDTEVTLDSADAATTVNAVPQLVSDVHMSGDNIQLLNGSITRATGGSINIQAAQSPGATASVADGSRVYVAPDAVLDVSGANVVLPVSANVIPVQLRGTELANSPLQQNGPLRSQTVYVDIRQGTPLANIQGEIDAIGYNVLERNLNGGSVTINSAGDAILAPGSVVDVAGGSIQYTGGYLNTTTLITSTGQLVGIGSANPNVLYKGIANTATVSDPKWGTSTTYQAAQPTYSPGYVEGKNGGTLNLSARQFVLDSTVNASVVTGLYQREPGASSSVASGTAGGQNTYEPYDQVPQPAALVIGTKGTATSDFIVDNVTIASGLVLPTLLNADGSPFNPLSEDPATDPLPASYSASVLRPELLGTQGFGSVSIYTNGKFLQPPSVALQFPAGGMFSATANLIDIEGQITVPGGSISATAETTAVTAPGSQFALTLGPQAALTADGQWVNDNPLLYPNGNTTPLFINGGSVSLSASSNAYSPGVLLAPGSRVDVSGGGQLTSKGTLNPGTGGVIAVSAAYALSGSTDPSNFESPRVELGGTLTGYGLFKGGTLKITDGAECIAVSNCSTDPGTLWVSPSQLATGGFGDYQLTADQGGLTVAPNTTVTLTEQNLQLPVNYQNLTNRSTLIGLAGLAVLPDQLRNPVSLSLAQSLPATSQDANGQYTLLNVTDASPSLTIGAGSLIQADPLASISLGSNIRIVDEGTLRAPGGEISLALNANLPEAVYNNTQAIWLGSQAVLDVAGVPRIYPNALGQPTGEVLPGGTVSLSTQRGFLELLPGSLIDVSGSSGVVAETGVGGGAVQNVRVASAGGVIDLSAADGAELGGTFAAGAGTPGPGIVQPAGGTFSLTLDASQRNDYGQIGSSSTFPGTPGNGGATSSEILVSATQPPIVINPGLPIPDSIAETAYVSANALATGGFDTINLKTASLQPLVSLPAKPGLIDFVGNVTLSAAESIALDSGTFRVSPGATAQVTAPYVEFGNSDTFYGNVSAATAASADNASAGGTLNVNGGFIEVYGTSALQGISTASFTSTGDLRTRGLLSSSTSATVYGGALYTDGNLNLTAQQIYPTTLSQFVVSADPNSLIDPLTGTITVQSSPGTAGAPLSAGGALTLSAGTIAQNGVLRAPVGAITLDASSITLGAGSLTSTSADGLTIPFGTTQGGIDWVYPLPNDTTVIYGTDGIAPPAQQVTLQGSKVSVNSGARINVAGGGDLLAYEWINGTGGTIDVLSNNNTSSVNGGRPLQFAIVPSLNGSVAPYDPNISGLTTPSTTTPRADLSQLAATAPNAATTLQVGDAVYLAGMAGLPAGVYQLLPARYALLPGAYLVTPESGYQDIRSGQSVPVLAGGSIIAGYQTVAGTAFGASRTSGFYVVPASVVLQQAQYTTTSANQFFASQASTAGVAAPRLPQDSGVLALVASDSLSLGGSLETSPGKGGLGAEVDISSADILVSPTTAATLPGQIALSPSSLDALGAQTLLIGGLNDAGAITTTAQTVEIAAGATLTAPDILLTAQNQVTVDGGATIAASGTAPGAGMYSLTGDGAFLSVSAGAQSKVTRSDATGAAGVLTLASGSTLSAANGAVYLEATDNVSTAGTLSIVGGDLAVQSSRIVLGSAVPGVTGTVLTAAVLGSEGLRNLLLESSAPIELNGSVTANAASITLDTPGLVDVPATDSAALVASHSITLQNSSNATSPVPDIGTGTLRLDAPNIVLNGGTFATSGFGTLALNASDALTATASGGLNAGGALSVTASQVTSGADVDLSLSATGAVSLLAPSKPAALTATNLGGSLAISGSSIDVATQIALPSGHISLTTTAGDLTLAQGGSIDVAGVVQQYDGVAVASPGGSVSLTSSGNVTLASGSRIDVSAGSGGEAGSITLSAPGAGGVGGGTVIAAGSLAGTGTAGAGGVFGIDAQQFDFSALNALLNAGGFDGGRSARLRGPGNLEVAGSGAASVITARQVSLEADQGSVLVDSGGTIDASGAAGGSVTLAGADGVTVNGIIDARATVAGQRGGTVTLESGDASGSAAVAPLLVNAGSKIDVSAVGPSANGAAGAGGSVLLSAPVATVQSWLDGANGFALAGEILGSTRTALVANHVYQNQNPDGAILSTDMSAYQADAATFMAGAAQGSGAAITAALSSACNCAFVLEPGVEIDATASAANPTGALILNSGTPWNLATWRYATGSGTEVPGVLTLRAQGGVTFDASLSDGFSSLSGTAAFTLPKQASDSWSYRIVAGADLTAANPQTVLAANPASAANVTICDATCAAAYDPTIAVTSRAYAPTMVRTGDGFIDVSASGSFVLGTASALLYTAGVAESGASFSTGRGSVALAYPVNGGDIKIDVAGNVVGAPASQFVNAWQWRAGSAVNSLNTPTLATAWTVNFQDFEQGVGALGGGDVVIHAGGDITDFSASIPTVGVPLSGAIPGVTAPAVLGGGNLTVTAGGSILGGSYDVGRGNATLVAGVDVGPSAAAGLSPLIGLGDASLAITARGNVQVSDIVNPTLLNQGVYQPAAGKVYFSTYGADSSASLTAIGGNLVLDDDSTAVASALANSFAGSVVGNAGPLDALPPVVTLSALSGNVDIGRTIVTVPSATGNLQVFANQSVVSTLSSSGAAGQLIVSDADPSQLPSAASPFSAPTPQSNGIYDDIAAALATTSPDQHAATPVYAVADAAGSLQPVRIVAENGSVLFPPNQSSATEGIWSAKPVQVVAGLDVTGLNLVAQNLGSGDVTSITAGRDITYPQQRLANGQVAANLSGIVVDGPGALQLTAGRDVNLGTSNGVSTRANLLNPVLPDNGASISVQAGISTQGASAANAAQYAAFIAQYVTGSTQFNSNLVAFVQAVEGVSALTVAEAQQQFAAMTPALQRTFVEELFFQLLQIYGSKAAASGNGDFSGAFAAISALFPGANPDTAKGETNPYAGNIELYFSRIYTEQGGNISLLAPGGEINVGLATPPNSFGIVKQADQLGIVAQTTGNVDTFTYNDLQVNQSRLFAADGGDILVWSTDGNIDAGAGAKTSISAPEVNIAYDTNGQPTVSLRAAIAGSGIQALAATPGVSPGNVYLFAPRGVVNAGDAGIVAGNLTVAATAVLGASNITVTGTAVGVPVTPPALGASFASASSTAGATSNVAENFNGANGNTASTPVADAAINWLDVFVTGLGEENCRPDDLECMKRESKGSRVQ
jgi:filamentous hemagglutinin family protein